VVKAIDPNQWGREKEKLKVGKAGFTIDFGKILW